MIEFDGCINGKAEKYFFRKNQILTMKLFLVCYALLAFPIALFAIKAHNWTVLKACGFMLIGITVLTLIPMTKKDKLNVIPQRIYTDKEIITSVAKKITISKYIGDEKSVIDHGEFYDLNCQVKCNKTPEKSSRGDFQPRHLRGRVFSLRAKSQS